MASDRFETFTVEARANTTARTVEVRLATESGWLSHLAILDSEAAAVLREELNRALDELAGEPHPNCSHCGTR